MSWACRTSTPAASAAQAATRKSRPSRTFSASAEPGWATDRIAELTAASAGVTSCLSSFSLASANELRAVASRPPARDEASTRSRASARIRATAAAARSSIDMRSGWTAWLEDAPKNTMVVNTSVASLFVTVVLFLKLDAQLLVVREPEALEHLLVRLDLHIGAHDLADDVIHVDRLPLDRAHRVDAVLAELELHDRARGVAHRAVVHDLHVFERVDQPALHVAGAARAHGRVDKSLAPTHRVEEVLGRGEPGLVRRFHEALGFGA